MTGELSMSVCTMASLPAPTSQRRRAVMSRSAATTSRVPCRPVTGRPRSSMSRWPPAAVRTRSSIGVPSVLVCTDSMASAARPTSSGCTNNMAGRPTHSSRRQPSCSVAAALAHRTMPSASITTSGSGSTSVSHPGQVVRYQVVEFAAVSRHQTSVAHAPHPHRTPCVHCRCLGSLRSETQRRWGPWGLSFQHRHQGVAAELVPGRACTWVGPVRCRPRHEMRQRGSNRPRSTLVSATSSAPRAEDVCLLGDPCAGRPRHRARHAPPFNVVVMGQ